MDCDTARVEQKIFWSQPENPGQNHVEDFLGHWQQPRFREFEVLRCLSNRPPVYILPISAAAHSRCGAQWKNRLKLPIVTEKKTCDSFEALSGVVPPQIFQKNAFPFPR